MLRQLIKKQYAWTDIRSNTDWHFHLDEHGCVISDYPPANQGGAGAHPGFSCKECRVWPIQGPIGNRIGRIH